MRGRQGAVGRTDQQPQRDRQPRQVEPQRLEVPGRHQAQRPGGVPWVPHERPVAALAQRIDARARPLEQAARGARPRGPGGETRGDERVGGQQARGRREQAPDRPLDRQQRTVDRHDAPGPQVTVQHQAGRHRRTGRVADDQGGTPTQLTQQRQHRGGHRRQRQRLARWGAGETVARQVGNDHLEATGQLGREPAERVRRRSSAVQQEGSLGALDRCGPALQVPVKAARDDDAAALAMRPPRRHRFADQGRAPRAVASLAATAPERWCRTAWETACAPA